MSNARIYSRCPACHNDTLTINRGRLLCTWYQCSDPHLIDRLGEYREVRAKKTAQPRSLKREVGRTDSDI